MRNPNKQVRKAVVDALKTATGLAVYENLVPIDLPLNSQYILVNSQSKRQIERSKSCWDWESSFNIDIHIVNEKGFSHSVTVDDIEELVLNAIDGLFVPTWHVKGREFVDSISNVVELPDHTVNRIVVVYNLWLAEQ